MFEIRNALDTVQALAEHHYDRQAARDTNDETCAGCADHPDYHLGIAEQLYRALGPLWRNW
jgi:hypothetical protein